MSHKECTYKTKNKRTTMNNADPTKKESKDVKIRIKIITTFNS